MPTLVTRSTATRRPGSLRWTRAWSSVGQPVSHGCIRVPNDVMEQLNLVLPLGTPVVVS